MQTYYPYEVSRLLNSTNRCIEDASSTYLCHILSKSEILREVFLEFLFNKEIPVAFQEDYEISFTGINVGGESKPDIWLRFNNGSIILVEAKVKHQQKRNQRIKYKMLLENIAGERGRLFILAQKLLLEKGLASHVNGSKTWNDLADWLDAQQVRDSLDENEQKDVDEFLEYLKNERVLLAPQACHFQVSRSGHIEDKHQKIITQFSERLSKTHPDLSIDVQPEFHDGHGGPFYRLGRPGWKNIFDSSNFHRLRLHYNNAPRVQKLGFPKEFRFEFIIDGEGMHSTVTAWNTWGDIFIKEQYRVRYPRYCRHEI